MFATPLLLAFALGLLIPVGSRIGGRGGGGTLLAVPLTVAAGVARPPHLRRAPPRPRPPAREPPPPGGWPGGGLGPSRTRHDGSHRVGPVRCHRG